VENWHGTFYDEKTHTGTLRNIMVRTGIETAEVMVVLIQNGDEVCFDYESLVDRFPEISTIVINNNPKKTNVILSDINKVIYGKGIYLR